MYKLLSVVLLVALFSGSFEAYSQAGDDYASINIYRLKEGAMSGGTGLSVKVIINDNEVTVLQTNTMLNYKLYSTGSVKIKCIAEFGGGPIGSPYVETIDFEKGKEYHISISAGSMTGVKGEIVPEKKLKKIQKNKFADSISLEEEK